MNRTEPTPIVKERNISSREKQTLEELKELSKTAIEIKKADKTDVWVIMDKEEYCEKSVLKEHLNTPTYQTAKNDVNKKVIS